MPDGSPPSWAPRRPRGPPEVGRHLAPSTMRGATRQPRRDRRALGPSRRRSRAVRGHQARRVRCAIGRRQPDEGAGRRRLVHDERLHRHAVRPAPADSADAVRALRGPATPAARSPPRPGALETIALRSFELARDPLACRDLGDGQPKTTAIPVEPAGTVPAAAAGPLTFGQRSIPGSGAAPAAPGPGPPGPRPPPRIRRSCPTTP
jgi:hypothetical protein